MGPATAAASLQLWFSVVPVFAAVAAAARKMEVYLQQRLVVAAVALRDCYLQRRRLSLEQQQQLEEEEEEQQQQQPVEDALSEGSQWGEFQMQRQRGCRVVLCFVLKC